MGGEEEEHPRTHPRDLETQGSETVEAHPGAPTKQLEHLHLQLEAMDCHSKFASLVVLTGVCVDPWVLVDECGCLGGVQEEEESEASPEVEVLGHPHRVERRTPV